MSNYMNNMFATLPMELNDHEYIRNLLLFCELRFLLNEKKLFLNPIRFECVKSDDYYKLSIRHLKEDYIYCIHLCFDRNAEDGCLNFLWCKGNEEMEMSFDFNDYEYDDIARIFVSLLEFIEDGDLKRMERQVKTPW